MTFIALVSVTASRFLKMPLKQSQCFLIFLQSNLQP